MKVFVELLVQAGPRSGWPQMESHGKSAMRHAFGPDSAFAAATISSCHSPLTVPALAQQPFTAITGITPSVFSPQNRPSFFSHISLILL
jgi:hypothetical protein